MPVTYVKKATTDPILLVADQMAPKVRKAYLEAVNAAAASTSLSGLADAIDRGDSAAVIAMLGDNFSGALGGVGLAAGVSSVRDAVQATFAAAAKAATAELPAKTAIELSFNLLNPETVKFIEQFTGDLIQGATAETKNAVKQVLLRGFTEGDSPAEMAREIRSVIGLTATQEKAIANYRAALESGQSSGLRDALGRSLRDGRYDRSLLNAIEQQRGLSAEKVDALVGRYRAKYLNYRANSIARTESVRAATGGQRQLWKQAKEQGLIGEDAMRRWIASEDDRTCDVCSGLDGETAELDDEFEGGIMEPPAHGNCRCTVALSFGKESERQAA